MSTNAAPVRVLVADDQKVVRDGLSLLLGMLPGVEVIGTAVDGTDAVRQAATCEPDVVLMDLSMPNCDGVEATRLIAGGQPDVRVVVLTAFADDDSVFAALRAGARGYLTKAGYNLAQINSAIHRLRTEANHYSRGLYGNNQEVYKLLRYGVPVKIEAGKVTETVHLVNWNEPEKNDFVIVEEVTLKGDLERSPLRLGTALPKDCQCLE